MNTDFSKTCKSPFNQSGVWPRSFGFSCKFQPHLNFKSLKRVFHSAASTLGSWTGKIVKTPLKLYGYFSHIGERMQAIFAKVHKLPSAPDQVSLEQKTQKTLNKSNSKVPHQRFEMTNASHQMQILQERRGDEPISNDHRTQMSDQDSKRVIPIALREQKSLKMAKEAAQIEMRAKQKLSDAIAREKSVHDQELALQPREQRLIRSLDQLNCDQRLVETQKLANLDRTRELAEQMAQWVQRWSTDTCKLKKERVDLDRLEQKNRSFESILQLQCDDLKQRQHSFEQRANELEQMDQRVKRLTERANEAISLRTQILNRTEKELQSLKVLQQSRENEKAYITLMKKKCKNMHAAIIEMTKKSYLDLAGSYQLSLQFWIDRNHQTQKIYMRNLNRIFGSRSVESIRAVEPSLLEEFFKMGKEELFAHILQNSMAEQCNISYEHIANDEQIAFFDTNAMTAYCDLNIQHYYQQKPICPITQKKPVALIYPYRAVNRQVYYLVPNAQLKKEQVARLISDYTGRRQERNVQTARELAALYPQFQEQIDKLIEQIEPNGISGEQSA